MFTCYRIHLGVIASFAKSPLDPLDPVCSLLHQVVVSKPNSVCQGDGEAMYALGMPTPSTLSKP